MSVPQPPFHSVSEELLYNIYLKFGNMADASALKESDINTLAKLNAILTDGNLMKADDTASLINNLKGNVPETGNSLEKLFNILQGLHSLKAEDIDTLAELNAIITDADLVKTEDLQSAMQELKGNAPAAGNTFEKLYALLQPVLSAWLQGGNEAGEAKPIGSKDNFALPFITANTERARLDTSGNFLLGWNGAAKGKLHIRTQDVDQANYAAYIEDPTQHILFGITNSGKMMINKGKQNLLLNGGWPSMSGERNLIFTSGDDGGKLVDTGNDNFIAGYHAASSAGINPARGLARNVVIGSEAGSSDGNGSSYEDSVYIGYKAGALIGLNTAHRNTMIGSKVGTAALLLGSDHTVIGYDAQVARANNYNTLIGSGTRAYNNLGDLVSNGDGLSYMTAIGAGASVRTTNTVVIGRVNDQIVLGAERSDHRLPGATDNTGVEGFKLHVIRPGGSALAVSGYSLFRDGNFSIALGEEGNGNVSNTFRINTQGNGGTELLMSAANLNASIEINDYQFGGSRNEVMRLSMGGYANTGILIRPNDTYNAAYGYRYLLEGTNAGQQGRYVSAFHAQISFPLDDAFPGSCSTQLFAAKANVRNHYIDGFYAEVKATDPNAQAFAYRSLASRNKFDGLGMTLFLPVVSIHSDVSAHAGANTLWSNGGNALSTALFINPLGAERTGVVISPGQAQANGLFIGPQQGLATHNYDGYLMWLQYSTNGNNVLAGTDKPMLYMRKHNAPLNNFDHTGAFIRLEENIGSSGAFLEAYKYDGENNVSSLKFAVDKNGVVSIGQLFADPAGIQGVGRIYFVGDEMKFVTPSGAVKTVQHN